MRNGYLSMQRLSSRHVFGLSTRQMIDAYEYVFIAAITSLSEMQLKLSHLGTKIGYIALSFEQTAKSASKSHSREP